MNIRMDRIHYAGDSILTGSEIARALLDYAQALAVAGTSATVDIPVVDEGDGSIGRSELLIGPASQLISDTEEEGHELPPRADWTRGLLRHGDSSVDGLNLRLPTTKPPPTGRRGLALVFQRSWVLIICPSLGNKANLATD